MVFSLVASTIFKLVDKIKELTNSPIKGEYYICIKSVESTNTDSVKNTLKQPEVDRFAQAANKYLEDNELLKIDIYHLYFISGAENTKFMYRITGQELLKDNTNNLLEHIDRRVKRITWFVSGTQPNDAKYTVSFKTQSRGDSLYMLTVKELQNRCKEKGLKGYSTLKKEELINLLRLGSKN